MSLSLSELVKRLKYAFVHLEDFKYFLQTKYESKNELTLIFIHRQSIFINPCMEFFAEFFK
jgi:hypothetical protein